MKPKKYVINIQDGSVARRKLFRLDENNIFGDEIIAEDNIYDFTVTVDSEVCLYYAMKKEVIKKFLPMNARKKIVNLFK